MDPASGRNAAPHSAQLTDTSSRLETGRAFFLAALELLRDPKRFYERGGTSLKRAMNKIVFAKLYVDGEEISRHELAEPLHDLVEAAYTIFRDQGSRQVRQAPATKRPSRPSNTNSPTGEGGAVWSELTGADLLAMALGGHGSEL